MKKTILFCLLTINIAAAQVPSYLPTNGLDGYWPFTGNANDESVNGNNGSVFGATLTTDRFGNPNSAYNFNGNSYITANKSVTFSTQVSFNVWAYFNSINSIQTFVESWGPSTTQRTFTLYCETNFRASLQTLAGQKYATSTIAPTTANWYMLTGTFDGAFLKLYLNGQLIQTTSTSSTSFNPSQYTFYTFGRQYPSIQYFNGKLDDIGIWNRALTQAEITGLYGALSTTQNAVSNTINIYPNPANDNITIDCGNLTIVAGYQIKIVNTLGQEAFSGAMNTQQYVVPLNTWTGTGVYFVKIYDANNNLLNTKKIILQ
jgi:hypothetical protein